MSATSPSQRASQDIFQEEDLGKALDTRLLLRLWRYVAPYRGQVALTLLMVAPMFLLELAPAWLIKTGLDRVVLAEDSSALAPAAGAEVGTLERLLEAPEGLEPLMWLVGLYVTAVVLSALLQYVHMVLMAKTGQALPIAWQRDRRQGAVLEAARAAGRNRDVEAICATAGVTLRTAQGGGVA